MSAQMNFGAQPIKSNGIGWFLVAICYTIMLGLIAMSTYHTDNFLSTMLVENPGSLFAMMISMVSLSICLSEIPLSKSIVTDYRFNDDKVNFRIVMKSILGIGIACLAVAGTMNSQHMNASSKDAKVESHQSKSNGYQARKQALDSQWRVDTFAANKIEDVSDRNIKKSQINSVYYLAVAGLSDDASTHQAKKPIQSFKAGSIGQTITSALLAFVCSFGLMFVSGFMTVYHMPITPQALISLVTKKDHGYKSSSKDIQMMQHEISPLVRGAIFGWLTKYLPSLDAAQSNVDDDSNTPSTPHYDGLNTMSDSPDTSTVRTPKEGALVDYTDDHYRIIKEGVLSGEVSPTMRPIKARLVSLNIRFVSDAERQKRAVDILEKLKAEEVIIDNPVTGKGKAKFALNPDYAEQDDSVSSGEPEKATSGAIVNNDEIGEFDIETRCGSCGAYNYDHLATLNNKQNGVVHCYNCDKNYMAMSHTTSNSVKKYKDLDLLARAEDSIK